MADIKSFPNNQDEYVGAEYMMKFLHGRTSGVFGAENNLKVVATESELAVTVTQGVGWMSNNKSDGVVIWNDTDNLKLDLELADASKTRIDRVVVSWKTTDYIARPTISILKGVAGGEAPALTNSDTMRQISLAQIVIPAGALTITASMVKDERMDETVCGIVTESVKIDTSGIQAQADGLIEALKETQKINQNLFDTWFASIKDTLDGDTAGKLLNMINDLQAEKAEKLKSYEVKVLANAWGDIAPYKQVVKVEGMTNDGFPIAFLSTYLPALDVEFNKISKIETNIGNVTFYADKDKPKYDLDIGIKVVY